MILLEAHLKNVQKRFSLAPGRREQMETRRKQKLFHYRQGRANNA
jgi:hypothetical protein